MAFWRGSTTSGNYRFPNWREFPRTVLVLAAHNSGGLVDAKFVNFCQGDEIASDFLQEVPPEAPHCTIRKHLKYKYLIDIEGNSWGTRLTWIMMSNSMPIKLESGWLLWFDKGLEPNKHYLPAKKDSSDLIAQVEWAKAHDKQAEAIAIASREFAETYLTKDSIYSYLYHLLVAYSQLFVEK